MTIEAGITIGLALIANAAAFGATLLKLGAIGERLDLLWAWYLVEHGFEREHDHRTMTPRDLRPPRRPPAPNVVGTPPNGGTAPPAN